MKQLETGLLLFTVVAWIISKIIVMPRLTSYHRRKMNKIQEIREEHKSSWTNELGVLLDKLTNAEDDFMRMAFLITGKRRQREAKQDLAKVDVIKQEIIAFVESIKREPGE